MQIYCTNKSEWELQSIHATIILQEHSPAVGMASVAY